MTKFNYKNSNYVVIENVSLKDAMQIITVNQRGSVIVVNNNGTLLGILSDGDTRRALLRGATLMTPISKLVNLNVIGLSDKDNIKKLSEEIFKTNTVVNIIPVVDNKNGVVDVIVRNPGVRKDL